MKKFYKGALMNLRYNSQRRGARICVGSVVRILFIGTALVPTATLAQLPQARLQSIFPAGGQRGTTVEISQAVGTDLDKATELVFSHPWFKSVLKVNTVDKRQQPVYGNWTVTIPAGLPLGIYDVRIGGALGLSNPRSFVVGDLVEVRETEPNNRRDKAGQLAINQTLNGRMDAGTDIDWFKFTGKKGQRVVIECWAHRIDSRMSPIVELYLGSRRLAVGRNESHGEPLIDATLPADGEYSLKVFDFVYAGGPEYFYRLSVHDKPHVDFVVPASGIPASTSDFTLYGRNLPGGEPSEFTIAGQRLQRVKVPVSITGNPLQLDAAQPIMSAAAGTDAFVFSWTSPAGSASPVTIHYAAAPTASEVEPNDTPKQVQKVTAPIEITGRFQNSSDTDRYQFEAKKGEVYVVEAYAERDGSIADPVLVVERVRLSRPKKDEPEVESIQRITQQDDNNQSIGANLFDTASDDPQFRLSIPEDGIYRVVISDRYADSRGDPTLQYRLCIRREQPDFRLVALTPVPMQDQGQAMNLWELGLRQGDHATLQVMAFRRDGMNEPIELSVEGLPSGVSCSGGTILPGQTQTTLFLVASEKASKWSGPIHVIGKAAGKTREARGGTILFNNGQGRRKRSVSRVMQSVVLSVQDQLAPFQVTTDVRQATLNQGQQLLVPVQLIKRYGFDADLPMQFVNPPPNAVVENKPIKKTSPQETLKVTINNNTPPGRYLFTLRAAAPVNYRYHLKEFEISQKLKADVEKPFAVATAEFAKVQSKKVAAEKRLKEATDLVAKTEKSLKEAEVSLKTAKDKAQAAYDEAAKVFNKVKEADDAARRAVAENEAAEQEARRAEEKLAAFRNRLVALKEEEKKNKDKATATAIVEAEKEIASATEAVNKAKAAVPKTTQARKERLAVYEAMQAPTEAARKKQIELQEGASKAYQAVGLQYEQLVAAKKSVDAATAEKKPVDEEFKDSQAKLQHFDAVKKDAERRFNEANTAARTQQLQSFFPVTVIDLTVKQALATLQLKLPATPTLKRGASLSVPVSVNRLNGFKGPLKLSLVLPPGVTGLSAAEVSIPADKKEGTLVIQASPQATQGQIAYLIIRGSGDFQGPSAADSPVNLTVQP